MYFRRFCRSEVPKMDDISFWKGWEKSERVVVGKVVKKGEWVMAVIGVMEEIK